ncbi:hypothetical protein LXL04_014977 [Taraxacum kok-saghyz]
MVSSTENPSLHASNDLHISCKTHAKSQIIRSRRDCKTGLLNRLCLELLDVEKLLWHFGTKLWTMKKEWQIVYDMITGNNTSGFVYDSVNRCGTVESPEETSSASSKKRKRKDPFIEGISKAAALLGKELREASTTLSQSLNAEVELQKKTSMVTAGILKIPSMNQSDKFKANRKIMREPEAVLTFGTWKEKTLQGYYCLLTEFNYSTSFGSQTCNMIQLQHNSITTVFNYSRIELHSSALQPTKQGLSSATSILLVIGLLLYSIAFAVAAILKARSIKKGNKSRAWKLTTFQRLDFNCDDVLDSLKEENIIGKGGVGIVYKGVMPNNEHVEVRP